MTTAVTAAVTGAFLLQAFVPVASALVTEPVEETPVQPTYPSYTVSMTGYNAVPGQTDSTPTQTSIGAYTNPDIIVALSSDLRKEIPYGSVIEVVPVDSTASDPNCDREYIQEMIGLRVVADAMHHRWKKKIDILFDHKEVVKFIDHNGVERTRKNPAKVLGFCKNVEIRVVGKIDTKNMPKSQDEIKLALEQNEIKLDENLALNEK